VITLLGLGATAWMVWGNKAKEANDQAKASAMESSATIIKGLDEQIERNQRLIAMRKQGATPDQANKNLKATATLGDLGNELSAINRGIGANGERLNNTEQLLAREAVMKRITELTTKMHLAETTGAAATALTQSEARAKFMKEYATKQEQLNEKLEEGRKLLGASFTAADEARIRKHYEVADSGAKKEQTAFKSLMTAIEEKIAANQLEAAGYGTLTDAQKMSLKLDAEIATGKNILTATDIKLARAKIAVVAAQDAELLSAKNVKQAILSLDEDRAAAYVAAMTEVQANEQLVVAYGATKAEIEALSLARLEERLAQRAVLELDEKEVAQLERMIAAKKRNVGALNRIDELTTAKKSAEDLDAFLDPAKAQSFGDALKDAFGQAGGAITKLTAALKDFGQRQAEVDKQRGNAANKYLNGLSDEKQYMADLAKISAIDTKNRLSSYGDMAGAAAGFFGEQSKGYETLMAVSKVFHAAELAMTLAELVPKGISAVLNQASGDPYTAFGRMAAMAAIVAGLGVAIGGASGSGGQSAADVQKKQGTGSVFGDKDAKSESISRSLERLEQNSGSLIPLNQGMLSALRSIEASMSGVANLVVRTPGVIDASNMGIQTGKMSGNGMSTLQNTLMGTNAAGGGISGAGVGFLLGGPIGAAIGAVLGGVVGKVAGKLWGSTKQNIVDSGVQFGGSVRDLQQGVGYNQYASVDTTKSSWFGLSKKTSNSVETAGLSAELSAQFGLIFTNVEQALTSAAVGLGVGADHVTKVLDALTIDTTKLSLKGLTGDALTEALNGVISKAMDTMSSAVFPELEKFRQVGEGYTETVVRLAANYAQVDQILASIGGTFGATGIASIAARERLIALAGGIEDFAKKSSSFNDNFLTEAERLAPVQKYVAEQLAAMGRADIDSRDKYKAAVQGLVTSGALATEAGAAQYAGLLDLADAFALTHAASIDLTKSVQAIADEHTDLQDKYDELTMSAVQLRAKERAGIDASNLALFDSVTALQDQKRAAEEASTILGLQAQLYEATGDKAAAAAVLQKQHEAALVDLTPAVRAATEATWAAQAAEKARKEKQDEANAILGLQAQMFDALGDKAGAAAVLEKQHIAALVGLSPALAAANLKLWAAQAASKEIEKAQRALEKSYRAQSDAIKDTVKNLTTAIGSWKKFKDSLLLGDLSPLSPEQKYAEAKRQFEKTMVLAKGGDATARDNLQAVEEAFLQASQVVNASDARYQADFQRVQQATDEAIAWAQAQVDVGQASLDALYDQVSLLIDIDDSVSSVSDAIKDLKDAMSTTAAGAAGIASNDVVDLLYRQLLGRAAEPAGLAYWHGAMQKGVSVSDVAASITKSDEYASLHASATKTPVAYAQPNYSSMGTSGMAPLAQEIKALRASNEEMAKELKRLRNDQQRQTGDLIRSNVDANATNAEAVSNSINRAADKAAYAERTKATFA
jgi:hypothetical protein